MLLLISEPWFYCFAPIPFPVAQDQLKPSTLAIRILFNGRAIEIKQIFKRTWVTGKRVCLGKLETLKMKCEDSPYDEFDMDVTAVCARGNSLEA